MKRPVLKIYNPKAAKTELHTDASAVGLGALLLQADKLGDPLKLVYAISRRTTKTERFYHSSRLELLAIAWASGRLRNFLIGIEFTIVTDCQCLVNLNAWKTQNPQIARWMSEINEFRFNIEHRKGENMMHADALSQAPVGQFDAKTRYDKVMSINTRDNEVLIFQQSDEKALEIIEILRKPEKERTKSENDKTKDFILREGLLYKRIQKGSPEKKLFYVPNT